MKLGTITRPGKKTESTSKKFDDGIIFKNCDVIATCLTHRQLGAIQKPDSGRIVCKTYIFINGNFLS